MMQPVLGAEITGVLLEEVRGGNEDVRGLVTFDPGTTHALSLSFQNVGNISTDYWVTAWVAPPGFPTQTVGQSGGSFVGAVAPGGSAQVSIPLVAPVIDGDYPIMIQIYAVATGDPSPLQNRQQLYVQPLQVDVLHIAVIRSGSASGSITGAWQFGSGGHVITFAFQNTGNIAIDVKATMQVADPAHLGTPATPAVESAIATVAKGATASFTGTLTAPAAPGTYAVVAWVTLANQAQQVVGPTQIGTITVSPVLGVGPVILVGWS